MRRPFWRLIVLAGLMTAAVPALASDPHYYPRGGPPGPPLERGAFRLSLGMYDLRGDSNFWDDNKQIFSGDANDFNDVIFGADVLWTVNPNVSLMLSGQYYEGSTSQRYLDPALSDLAHDTSLQLTPLKFAFVIYPAGRRAGVVPYVGAGAGLYWWRYEETGWFWDFDFEQETFQSYVADGTTAGYFLLAGLDVPIRPTWSIFFEAQWQEVKDDLNQDFSGFGTLDMSGTQLSAGFAWKF